MELVSQSGAWGCGEGNVALPKNQWQRMTEIFGNYHSAKPSFLCATAVGFCIIRMYLLKLRSCSINL